MAQQSCGVNLLAKLITQQAYGGTAAEAGRKAEALIMRKARALIADFTDSSTCPKTCSTRVTRRYQPVIVVEAYQSTPDSASGMFRARTSAWCMAVVICVDFEKDYAGYRGDAAVKSLSDALDDAEKELERRTGKHPLYYHAPG